MATVLRRWLRPLRRVQRRWFGRRPTDVPYRWLGGLPDCGGRRVCLFVTFAPGGRLTAHALHHSRAWASHGFDVLMIVCLDDMGAGLRDGDTEHCRAVMIRQNIGYDFAAWATAILTLPTLGDAAFLVTVNDSVFGPLKGFERFVDRLLTTGADHVGTLESYEREQHYQSFLLGFAPGALRNPAFWRFWSNVRVGDREAVITHHELRMLPDLRAGGVSAIALFPGDPKRPVNRTLTDWREMVDLGFPFVKVQLLRDNPRQADISGWDGFLARHAYDPAFVYRHLGSSPASDASSFASQTGMT